MHNHALRREKLRHAIDETGADSLLVTNEVNVRYLTGFTGDSSYLLLTRDHTILLSDTRYEQQLAAECPDVELEIRSAPTTMLDLIERVVSRCAVNAIAFEASSMTVGLHESLRGAVQASLAPTRSLVETLRSIKDESELQLIRTSIEVAERVMRGLMPDLRASQTEAEVAAEIEYRIRMEGGEGCAFAPIVAAGPHAALPHAHPRTVPIGDAALLLLDWGAVWKGYRSDLTRVLATDRITPELEAVYGVVLHAQAAAIDAVRPGVTLGEVDAAAREVIANAGYGDRFGHGLGHGFGLEIHEHPRLAPRQTEPLQAGMVITIEPGIYLPGVGGVRIEDDVLVTADGSQTLTAFPKQFAESTRTLH